MIDLFFSFWYLVLFLALLGAIRGWQKEVIALTTMIAMMALLTTFGAQFIPPIAEAFSRVFAGTAAQDLQITLQIVLYSLVTFFGYQLAGPIAGALSGRFGERIRVNLERRFIGFFFGLLNGYMYYGALWGFLEYVLTRDGYQRLGDGLPYAFPAIITRPAPTTLAYSFAEYLPQGIFSPTVWLAVFFVAFFILIIALI